MVREAFEFKLGNFVVILDTRRKHLRKLATLSTPISTSNVRMESRPIHYHSDHNGPKAA